MLRAFKDKITNAEKVIVFLFAMMAVPAVAACEAFGSKQYLGLIAVGALALAFAIVLLSLLVFDHEQTTLESLGLSLLSAVYPTLLLSLLVLCNHGFNTVDGELVSKFGLDSRLMILMVFVISPISDTIAFAFGCTLKKYLPQKLAPKLSPNKTIIGFIGGLVGGMLGATILYFVYNLPFMPGSYDQMYIWLPVYMSIGLVAALSTAFGDLVESSIKRKVGLKDMGKIMPGHGGVLDRIDGTIYATVAVYVCFAVIHLFL
jgi:phosphatidate cytidylyltransferase